MFTGHYNEMLVGFTPAIFLSIDPEIFRNRVNSTMFVVLVSW